MPSVGARPVDLAFDHAAAAGAVAALERAMVVMTDVTSGRSTAAHRARTGFRGVYADDFAADDAMIGVTTLDAFLVLRDLRAQIETAAGAARAAQTVRAREQQAWDEARAATPIGVA